MEKNIGKTDKRARLFIGIVTILVGAHANSVWGVLGMIPIITAEIGICPLYSLFHLTTIPQSNRKQR